MFARLTFIKILPEHIDQHRKIYYKEVVPMALQQKGLIRILSLEPANKKDEFISVTEWESRDDAEAYERSSVYRELAGKINGLTAKAPVLKTYTVDAVSKETPLWIGEDSEA